MEPKHKVGHKVIVRPVSRSRSPRECTIEPYVGQIGEVIDYYWISPRAAEAFFIYMVRVGADKKKIVLHEDEIEAYRGE